MAFERCPKVHVAVCMYNYQEYIKGYLLEDRGPPQRVPIIPLTAWDERSHPTPGDTW